MDKTLEKITRARTGLILDHPFFGTLALKLKLTEDPTCETMWVDGIHMGYSPKFVEKLNMPELKGVIAHEVMHCAMSHHTRRQERDPKKWNVAGDYVINALLDQAGFTLPEDGLLDPQYASFSTEHVYSLLPDMPPGDGNGGADPGGTGEVRDCPADSDSELKHQEADWKISTAQAARAAKMMGKLPGDLERLVEGLVQSKVNWKEVLRRFVSETCKDDYSWMRPNRRFIADGLYLPSLWGERMGEIVVAIDTSGSIGQEELNQFAAEITNIAEDVKPTKIHVVYCDTKVAHTEEFTEDDLPLKLQAKGGGGTDFRPPFEWVEEQNLTPNCLVYLTDMYCDSFPDPPHYETLWISTTSRTDAPFGEVVEMNP